MNILGCCVLALVSIIAFGIIVFCVARNRTALVRTVNIRQKGGAGELDTYPLLVCAHPYTPVYDTIIRTAERLNEGTKLNGKLYQWFGENLGALAAARWICILDLLESACAKSSIFNNAQSAEDLAQVVVAAGDVPITEIRTDIAYMMNDIGNYDFMGRLAIIFAKIFASVGVNSLSGGGKDNPSRINIDMRTRFDREGDDQSDEYSYPYGADSREISHRMIYVSNQEAVANQLLSDVGFIEHTAGVVGDLRNEDLIAFINTHCEFVDDPKTGSTVDVPTTAKDVCMLCAVLVQAVEDEAFVESFGNVTKEDVIALLIDIFKDYIPPVVFQDAIETWKAIYAIFTDVTRCTELFTATDVLMCRKLTELGILRSANLQFVDTVKAYHCDDSTIDRGATIHNIHVVLYTLAKAMIDKYKYPLPD